MDEKERFVEHGYYYLGYRLFSGKSVGVNRGSRNELLSGIVYRRMGGLGFWNGVGNGPNNYVPAPGWGR